jgi:hypothetical protein
MILFLLFGILPEFILRKGKKEVEHEMLFGNISLWNRSWATI